MLAQAWVGELSGMQMQMVSLPYRQAGPLPPPPALQEADALCLAAGHPCIPLRRHFAATYHTQPIKQWPVT